MQAIAREFNLSETTFVERRPAAVEQAEGVRVRIFTTQEELNFAGHPTLGTASVLKLQCAGDGAGRHGDAGGECGRGPGALQRRRACFGEMTQRDPEFGAELDRGGSGAADWASTLEDLDPALPPQVVSTGTAFAIVAAAFGGGAGAAQGESARRPRRGCASAERGGSMCWARPGRRTRAESRSGARACSSTAAKIRRPARRPDARSAIWSLAAQCASRQRIHVRQGVEIGRPSDLFLTARRRIGEGDGCARRRQHCSCGKGTAFPAVMHMLSTGIHHGKLTVIVNAS